MPKPAGFSFEVHGSAVVVSHHGRRAATLRGVTAERFLADVASGDAQELMARATGNYKRGNERAGKQHPRRDAT